MTAGIAATADEFFIALKAQDFAKAKTYLAEDFRAATSDEDLRNFVARSALEQLRLCLLESRSIENSTGTLEGVVETASRRFDPDEHFAGARTGRVEDLYLAQTRRGNQSLQSGECPVPLPRGARGRRRRDDDTYDFADAVARKDFTAFHANTASVLQKQLTAADLQKAMRKPSIRERTSAPWIT